MNNFFVNVLLPLPFDKPFTYKTTSQKIEIGDLVKVSFRKKDFFGLVVEVNLPVPEISSDKIKEISQVNDQVKFSKKLIDFIDWIAAYNLAPKGLVLKAFIGILNSFKTKKPNFTAKKQIINSQKFSLKKLSVKQEKVADEILEEVNKKETRMIKVNCGDGNKKDEEIMKTYKIDGYPTIIKFDEGKSTVYNGDRDINSFKGVFSE